MGRCKYGLIDRWKMKFELCRLMEAKLLIFKSIQFGQGPLGESNLIAQLSRNQVDRCENGQIDRCKSKFESLEYGQIVVNM